jgi:hypothetical protein
MKVSKADTIRIDYHNTHSKNEYREIISARNRSVLSGVPIEIVSKIILRHTQLSTQRYLGTVSRFNKDRFRSNY